MFQKKSYSQQKLRKNDGAGITSFCRKYFLSLPINFAGEPFCVSKSFCYRKKFMYKKGGWEFHNLPSKLVSALKNIVGEHFNVSLISDIERCLCL